MAEEQKEPEYEVVDDDDFFTQQKGSVSYGSIVLKTIDKIRELYSVELRGGYSQMVERVNAQGSISSYQVYIPDAREILYNAIMYLKKILAPKFEKTAKNKELKINEFMQERLKQLNEINKKVSANPTDEIVSYYKDEKLAYADELFGKLMFLCDNEEWFGQRYL